MDQVPHTKKGLAWKVQFYEAHTMSWRDVQKRHAVLSDAIDAAYALNEKTEQPVRLMVLDLDTGKRDPRPVPGICMKCGCTDARSCDAVCSWATEGICSNCV